MNSLTAPSPHQFSPFLSAKEPLFVYDETSKTPHGVYLTYEQLNLLNGEDFEDFLLGLKAIAAKDRGMLSQDESDAFTKELLNAKD